MTYSANTSQIAEKDEHISKVAHSVGKACELIDKGFEYVTELDGNKICRKRK
jgi:hypothetical protein